MRILCRNCGHLSREVAVYCGMCGLPLRGMPERLADPSSQPGRTFGERQRYQVVRRLGQGGFGEAYLARDSATLDHLCVIKRLVLQPAWDAETRRRVGDAFEREARLLVSLSNPGHPAIPDIYEYLPEQHALVMKYVTGETLHSILSRHGGPLPEAEALRYVRDVCDALHYMHEHQPEPVLHRDIKPGNILRDDRGRIWLIDFGMAHMQPREPSERAASDELSGGTAGFTAPEQWLGMASPATDIFAVSAMLWMLLTARSPTTLSAGATPTVRNINPNVRPEVERLIQRGMQMSATDRPGTLEYLAEVKRLLGQIGIPRPEEPPASDTFVGRAAELHRYQELLQHERLAIITGMAGIGKTTLAAQCAREEQPAQTLFWHTFREGEGLDDLMWRLAAFLAWNGRADLWELLDRARTSGEQLPPVPLRIDYLVRLLAECDALICLDDLHLVEDDPQIRLLVERLLGLVRQNLARLLLVSRHRPWFVGPDGYTHLGGLSRPDAEALLARHQVQLGPDDAARLIAITDGSPQLLTLASALLRRTNQRTVIERLAEAEDIEEFLLTQVDALLSGDERAVMGAVAALLDQGGTQQALEALLETGVLRTLRSLAQRHLLLVRQADSERVYSQHAIVRAFYYRMLGPAERRRLHRRAADHYRVVGEALRTSQHAALAGAFAESAQSAIANLWEIVNSGQARALALLLDQLLETTLEPALQLELLCARGEVGGLLRETEVAAASYQRALDLLVAQSIDDRAHLARICRGMGELLEHDAPDTALEWIERGRAQLSGTGTLDEATLLVRAGSAQLAIGHNAAAAETLEESLRLLPPSATEWRANALNNLGIAFCSMGEPARGVTYYHEALRIYEATRNYWKMIFVWQNLGIEMEIAGDWGGAASEYLKALELAKRLGSTAHQARIALSLGVLALNRGDDHDAEAHLNDCLALARDHGMNEYIVSSQSSLGFIWLRRGQYDRARAELEQADALASAMSSLWQIPEIARGWARWHLAQDAPALAREQALRAVAVARELDDPIAEGAALRELGSCQAAQGDWAGAAATFGQSLELLDSRDPYEAACTRLAWGSCALAAGAPGQAGPPLRAAHATFMQLGAKYDATLADGLLLALENTSHATPSPLSPG